MEAGGRLVGPIDAGGATVTVTDALFVDTQPVASVTVRV